MAVVLPPHSEVLDYLLSFDTYSQVGRPQEGIDYVTTHADRFMRSMQFLPRYDRPVAALELGSSPYYMSILMLKYLGYDITPANYFGDYGDDVTTDGFMKVSSAKYDESYSFYYKQFNLELDPFPYPDNTFEVVLCCEILEHLARTPSHLMREVHRVLKPGGRFFVTTPNAIRAENIYKMIKGYNAYSAYSGYGVYGRHNREYNQWELAELFRVHNFEPQVFVEDAYPHGKWNRLFTRFGGRWRRDNLFGLGTKQGITVERYPRWLYEYPQALRRVTKNSIEMGNRDYLQLGDGWSDFEHLPPGVRWVDREAQAFLLAKGTKGEIAVQCKAGSRGVDATLLVRDVEAGRITLAPNEERELAFAIPADVIRDYMQGKLHMARVDFKLATPNADGRRLGVTRIEVR